MKSSSALLTASAFRPAWVSTPAVRAAVDTFYFSALASVRPTTSSPHTLRCPQTFGRLRLLLRGLLCNIHRRMPSHLLGTPCRTEHRSETWAIPSLCRATPSATSEHLVELLGSSPIPRSFVASCVSFQLRLLPSTGVTRLRRYNEPLRHPIQLQISAVSECRPVFWKYPLHRNAQGNQKQSGTRCYKVNPQSNQERAFHSIYLTLLAALCPTKSKLSRVSGLTAKLLANPYG